MPNVAQQLFGDRAGGDARRGLARRGALEDVAKIAAVVLHPADQIDVPRTRCMHAPLLRLGGVDVPHAHRRFPVLEIAIADDDRDRRAERLAAANAADDLDLIVLDLHPPAAPVAVLAPRHVAIDPLTVEPHARRHAGDDDRQLRAVRLAGGNGR